MQKVSQFPILSAFAASEPNGSTDPLSSCERWQQPCNNQEISQFRGGEVMAAHWKLTRDGWAYQSHQLGAAIGPASSSERSRPTPA